MNKRKAGIFRLTVGFPLAAMVATFAHAASAPTAPAAPPQLWQTKLPERVASISVASNAACVAARTRSRIHVIDSKGRRDWETADILSSAYENGVHAVSPTCDWVAVFHHGSAPDSMGLSIARGNGSPVSVPIAAATGVNGPRINSLDISPDGRWLAVGFETGYLWIVSRDGVVRTRVGPLQGAGVTARFAADSKHVLLTGWFNDGLVDLDGTWVWKYDTRNLIASRKFDLFAALRAPMHGPQYGEIAILDAAGKERWNDSGYDASMAIAPDGSFVAFVGRTETANQPTQPPFPLYSELNDTPEIWIRDPGGKVLAHGPFDGQLNGVSGDSSCIIAVPDYSRHKPQVSPPWWVVGFNRNLKEVWRLDFSRSNPQYPQTAEDLLLGIEGDTVRAWRIPPCNR